MAANPRINLLSHGIKHGLPPKADIMLDARSLSDGCNHIEDQVHFDGPTLQLYWELLQKFLEKVPKRRRELLDPWSEPVSILCFCAYGVNRSVQLKRYLAYRLKQAHPKWDIRVMEVTKRGQDYAPEAAETVKVRVPQ